MLLTCHSKENNKATAQLASAKKKKRMPIEKKLKD